MTDTNADTNAERTYEITPVGNPAEPDVAWRGVNHLALVTPDMDGTVRFYHGVLGMRLVSTLRAGPMRHYFFEIAPGNTIAFFEWKGGKTFSKPAGIPIDAAIQFDHLSFNVADDEVLHELRTRLKSKGCEVTDIVDHGFVHSIYFTDNNGIALEASCWILDATARPTDYADGRLFMDPRPVAAVRELAASGELEWEPATELVDAPFDVV
ncbi:MAG TPA: VOC family protein [Acidimicrobiales bacterium]|nr:VOC family protein [Acidimicrobiales bacterium]